MIPLPSLAAVRRVGPYVVIGLLLLALFLVNGKRNDAVTLADARLGTIKVLGQRVEDATNLVTQRDTLIAQQNEGITALAKAAEAGRTVYLTTYARADEQAKAHDDRAAELLAMTIDQTDELAACRASKTLMLDELGR